MTRVLRLLTVVAVVSGVPALVANAAAQCSLSVTPMAFGTYNVYQATPTDATATVTVGCLISLTMQVRMNRGQHAPSFSPRQMNRSGERLNYNLYFDSIRTQIWGDGTAGTVVWSPGLVLLARSHTVYGRIPAQQNVSVGTYADIVTVTAIF